MTEKNNKMENCQTPSRKVRSDKGSDKINTSTKYALYFVLGAVSTSIYWFTHPFVVKETVVISVPMIEEVCKPEKVIEYVYGGCNSNTK